MNPCQTQMVLATPEQQKFYGEACPALQQVIGTFLMELERIRERETAMGRRDPVEHCKARIKSPHSMRDKLRRMNLPVNESQALKSVYDAAGARIICRFYSDIYQMVEEIRRLPDFEVINEKDYIGTPKPNGYRSYHIILKDRRTSVYLEVQLRTIAMDCWASLEHQLKYKQDIENVHIIVDELKRCADEMAATDLSMQTIRDLIEQSAEKKKEK